MTRTLSCIHLTLRNSFHSHECGKNQSQREHAHAQTKPQDNSTSGRGARASYRTMLPEISARRSLLEPSFRYLSSPTGREGEISRPLDHMRQIPFIHSARFINVTNFYIYRTVLQIVSPCGTLRCVLMQSIFDNCARAPARTFISTLRPHVDLLLFFIRYVLVSTGAKQI